jgi:hypothetical protein
MTKIRKLEKSVNNIKLLFKKLKEESVFDFDDTYFLEFDDDLFLFRIMFSGVIFQVDEKNDFLIRTLYDEYVCKFNQPFPEDFFKDVDIFKKLNQSKQESIRD